MNLYWRPVKGISTNNTFTWVNLLADNLALNSLILPLESLWSWIPFTTNWLEIIWKVKRTHTLLSCTDFNSFLLCYSKLSLFKQDIASFKELGSLAWRIPESLSFNKHNHLIELVLWSLEIFLKGFYIWFMCWLIIG